MRIALYHNLPSGGAKRALFETVRRLAGAEYQFDLFTLSSANHTFADVRPFTANYKVIDFEPGRLLESPFGRLNQAVRHRDLGRLNHLTRHIADEIEHGQYDVVYVHPCHYEKAPSLLTHLQHMPTVYYCQEPLRRLYETMPKRPYDAKSGQRSLLDKLDPLPNLYHNKLKRLDDQNMRRASRVLVNSRFMKKSVNAIYGVDAQVSYLGVDVAQFRPLGLRRDSFLLSVGSLTPLKGFDFLIEALGAMPVAERRPLRIVSNFQNPPEKTYLQQLAADKGVTLQLLSNITDKELIELYNQAALTIYAPIREPFGLVALESMACGTPVVAVREGGMQETVVHEQSGLLVERDAAKFATAIQRLLADADLTEAYGRFGRTHITENWTWDHAAATLRKHLSF